MLKAVYDLVVACIDVAYIHQSAFRSDMDQIVDDSVRRFDIYVEIYYILGTRSNESTHIVLVLACRQIKATV